VLVNTSVMIKIS